jgi:hypothetical protein
VNLLIRQWPVVASGVLYLIQSGKQAAVSNWPMAGMWAGYAVANVALIFAQQ